MGFDTGLVLLAVFSFSVGLYCIRTCKRFEELGARCCGVSFLVTWSYFYGYRSGEGPPDKFLLIAAVMGNAYIFAFIFLGAIIRQRVLAS
jgi:hypothetical protein